MKGLVLTLLTAVCIVAQAGAQETPKDYADVSAYLGRKGDFKDGVFKIGIPRSDLKVTVQGIALPTAFGFAGWIAMEKGKGGHDVLMGDLPLTEEEVNPVMAVLLNSGIQITALHNHFFYMEPMLYFMHIHGHGAPMDLAQALKPALDLIGKEKPAEDEADEGHEASAPLLKAGSFNTGALDTLVGAKGDKMGDVYKYTIGRKDLHLTDMGANVNARMGLNTWAALYGGDEDAVVAGDVAMLPGEVNDVLKILRSHNIEVVAIHQHMIDTKPQIIFLHYWGRGRATDLATTFRAVLDRLGSKSS